MPETQDQTDLAVRAKAGDSAARTELVKCNQKFIIMVARQYIGQSMELDDLIQEGNIGLLRAIDDYDPKMGNKFLTYASWWIKQSILQALAEHIRQVRLPVNRINVLERYKKIKRLLSQELMREPSHNEILVALGIEEHELYEQHSVSYSTPLYGEDNTGTLLDVLESDTPSPDKVLLDNAMTQEIGFILNKLNKREQTILRMCYGVGYERAYTLEEIGDKLNLTRERIRQLKEKALKQLRRMNRHKKLDTLKD